uniref:Protein kinase domain-containing protein n=1 Tax=Ganoderma boninense TaxID=34458 RepID=A0A5K1JUY6_9APHY|nr:Protein kinase domain-containing protein [Ganoderma boninense]
MPPLNRLLVLAVLSLSVYVQAAPVRDAARRAELMATDHSAITDPADNFIEVGDDFDTVDSDEDHVELGLDDQGPSTPEDFAFRKAKPKSAPRPPKVIPPKRKSTKAVRPKTTAKPPPPTTKATTTKVTTTSPRPVTTTAKVSTSTKATSTTSVAPETTTTSTTSKPSNPTTTSATANPQKTATETKTTTKTQTKTATKTTSESDSTTESETATPTESETETDTPTATACSTVTLESTPTAIAARAYNYVAQLFRRDDPEFIGWHGTNSDTAAFWTSQGQLEQPLNPDGLLDFLGLGPNTTDGTGSGAESAIGPGVYVVDDQETCVPRLPSPVLDTPLTDPHSSTGIYSAIAFASNNAQANANTTAQLCAIFAKSSATWRTATPKAFIPEDLVGDSADAATKAELEQARLDHVAQAVPGVNATDVVKFALLDPQTSTGQLVLPALIAEQFTATCFGVDDGAAPNGTSTFPDFSYNGTTLRSEWNIASETAGASDCV